MRGDYQVEDWVMLCLTLPSGNVIKRPAHISAIEPYYDRGEIAFYHYTVGNIFQFGKQCERLLPNKGFEPIPLTPEILEKNGFEPIRQDAGEPCYWQFFDKEEGHVINAFRRIYRGLWIECSNATTETSVNKQCEYVHELQHALKLCEIEKEVVI